MLKIVNLDVLFSVCHPWLRLGCFRQFASLVVRSARASLCTRISFLSRVLSSYMSGFETFGAVNFGKQYFSYWVDQFVLSRRGS